MPETKRIEQSNDDENELERRQQQSERESERRGQPGSLSLASAVNADELVFSLDFFSALTPSGERMLIWSRWSVLTACRTRTSTLQVHPS